MDVVRLVPSHINDDAFLLGYNWHAFGQVDLVNGGDEAWLEASAMEVNFTFRLTPDAEIPQLPPTRFYLRARSTIGPSQAPWGYCLNTYDTFADQRRLIRVSQAQAGTATYEVYAEQGSGAYELLHELLRKPSAIVGGAMVAGGIDQPDFVRLHQFYVEAHWEEPKSWTGLPPGTRVDAQPDLAVTSAWGGVGFA